MHTEVLTICILEWGVTTGQVRNFLQSGVDGRDGRRENNSLRIAPKLNCLLWFYSF